jgi:hypothetical protein
LRDVRKILLSEERGLAVHDPLNLQKRIAARDLVSGQIGHDLRHLVVGQRAVPIITMALPD